MTSARVLAPTGAARIGAVTLVVPWMVAVTALDLATKAWARAQLAPLSPGPEGPWLRLGLVTNQGASFGIGAGHPVTVAVISAAAVLALIVWLFRAGRVLERTGVALALGGGLGNLIDRLLHGAVTDWIHLAGYPATFNLADVAIRIGAVAAVLSVLLTHAKRPD